MKNVSHTHYILMEVTTANTCPLDSDQHLTGTWLWFWHIINTDVFLPVESCSPHRHCRLAKALDELNGIKRGCWNATVEDRA